ncbi:alpha/beta fold hydrolase [Thermodesulfobacteriota bacterium]
MPKVTVDDGVEINYCVDDLTNPWDDVKDTILIHHGAGEHSKYYIPMVPYLARKYQVLRFDARGRGGSTAPPEGSTLSGSASDDSPTAIGERCLKDSLSLMDQMGIDKVHWFGNAAGGWIGIHCAVEHPDRIKSLVLCGSPYKYSKERVLARSFGEKNISAAVEKLGMSEWLKKVNLTAPNLDPLLAGTKLVEWDLAERRKIPAHVYARFYRYATRIDYSDWIPKIKCPTLILVGAKSRVAPLEQQRFMEQQIPNAKLVVFEEVGARIHTLMPERCAETILDFLQTIA